MPKIVTILFCGAYTKRLLFKLHLLFVFGQKLFAYEHFWKTCQ